MFNIQYHARGSHSHAQSWLLLNCCYLVAQLCPTLCDPMDCSPPGFFVHGIPQARTPSLMHPKNGAVSGLKEPYNVPWSPHVLGVGFLAPVYFLTLTVELGQCWSELLRLRERK